MDRQYSGQTRVVYLAPRTWLGRLASVGVAIVLVILAVFFFAIFLAVFSVLAIVVIARALWVGQKVRRKETDEILEAEFSVEEGHGDEPGQRRRLEQRHGRGPGSE